MPHDFCDLSMLKLQIVTPVSEYTEKRMKYLKIKIFMENLILH